MVDPDNIIQDFKTVRLGFTLQQNRYTALTSMKVQITGAPNEDVVQNLLT